MRKEQQVIHTARLSHRTNSLDQGQGATAYGTRRKSRHHQQRTPAQRFRIRPGSDHEANATSWV